MRQLGSNSQQAASFSFQRSYMLKRLTTVLVAVRAIKDVTDTGLGNRCKLPSPRITFYCIDVEELHHTFN